MTLVVTCPNCGKQIPWTPEQRWRPFCSERCKLIDLGEWASENRSIPDHAAPAPEQESDAPPE